MNRKKKIKIKIKINKNYKENMETDTEKTENNSKTTASTEPKEEDFSWAKESNSDLIKEYIKYPFDEWKTIIDKLNLNDIIFDKKSMYQETCCKVLKECVFKGEHFLAENNLKNIDIFPTFLNEKKIKNNTILFDKIKPDFIISSISKPNFIKIFDFQDFMFKYDQNYNNLENIDIINIIGELKINPDHIKKDQKSRYLTFCEYANALYKKNEYFITLYIFDFSYKKLFSKNLYINNPMILGYIPKLFEKDYFDLYNKLKQDNENGNMGVIITDNSAKNENTFKDNKELQNNENLITGKIINNMNNADNTDKDKEFGIKVNNININIIDKKTKNNDNGLEIKTNKYNNMTKKELLYVIREKENLIINKEQKLEDEKIGFEDEIKKLEEEKNKEINEEIKKFDGKIRMFKRNKNAYFLQKKREIEDEKYELENITEIFNNKKVKNF